MDEGIKGGALSARLYFAMSYKNTTTCDAERAADRDVDAAEML
ncbi:MAG: hypothetical protein OXQ29_28315 [Rhodospirillaceae bacterium]|nr:hypothetical protein [Rhodospirillaceae bacterium]